MITKLKVKVTQVNKRNTIRARRTRNVLIRRLQNGNMTSTLLTRFSRRNNYIIFNCNSNNNPNFGNNLAGRVMFQRNSPRITVHQAVRGNRKNVKTTSLNPINGFTPGSTNGITGKRITLRKIITPRGSNSFFTNSKRLNRKLNSLIINRQSP